MQTDQIIFYIFTHNDQIKHARESYHLTLALKVTTLDFVSTIIGNDIYSVYIILYLYHII